MSIIDSVIDKCLKMLAARIHANDQKVGDLSQLTTDEKSSLVVAINGLAGELAGRENINTARVEQIIADELNKLTNGASAAFDTLAEIEAEFGKSGSQVAVLLAKVGVLEAKLEAAESRFNELEAFVGFAERETLPAEITRILNAGA